MQALSQLSQQAWVCEGKDGAVADYSMAWPALCDMVWIGENGLSDGAQ